MRRFTTFATAIAATLGMQAQPGTFADLKFFAGSGPDTVALVLDFNEPFSTSSFAFGVLVQDSISFDDALAALSAADANLQVTGNPASQISYYGFSAANSGVQKWTAWIGQPGSFSKNSSTGHIAKGEWGSLFFGDTTTTNPPQVQEVALHPATAGLNPFLWELGTGTHSATVIIDFLDGMEHRSYRLTVNFNDSIQISDALDLIDQQEGITINMAGGFLNDIIIHNDNGMAASPNFWGTWKGASMAGLKLNSGISEYLKGGEVFGAAYTDFFPALRPRIPQSLSPARVSLNVPNTFGSGTDTAFVLVDFQDMVPAVLAAVLFDAPATGEDILETLQNSGNSGFQFTISGGFLMNVSNTHQIFGNRDGIGGAPNYWGTWSATNGADWQMNMGLSTPVDNGDWFGLSYTDFNPAILPVSNQFEWAALPISVPENNKLQARAWPNPTHDFLQIETQEAAQLTVTDLTGSVVLASSLEKGNNSISTAHLPVGVYIFRLEAGTQNRHFKIIVQ